MNKRTRFYISIILILNLLVTGIFAEDPSDALKKAQSELDNLLQEYVQTEEEEAAALKEKKEADDTFDESSRLYEENSLKADELNAELENSKDELKTQKKELDKLTDESEKLQKKAQKNTAKKAEEENAREKEKQKLLEDWKLETDEKNDFIQTVSWKSDPNVYQYKVEIYSVTESKNVKEEITEESAVRFSLPAGKYQFRVSAYDFLGKVSAVSPWRSFEILKAKKPVVNLLEENVEVTASKSKVEIPVKTADVTSESKVSIINSEGKEIQGKLNLENPDAVKAEFQEVDEGFWKLKVTNPGGLSTVTDIVDVFQKDEDIIDVEEAEKAVEEKNQLVMNLTDKITEVTEEMETAKLDRETARVQKETAVNNQEAAQVKIEKIQKKKEELKADIQKAQEKVDLETENLSRYQEEQRKLEEEQARLEQKRLAEEKEREEEERRLEEERLAKEKAEMEEAQRLAEEKARAEEERRLEEERLAKEKAEKEEEERLAKEEEKRLEQEKKQQKEAEKAAKGRQYKDLSVVAGVTLPFSLYNGELFGYNEPLSGNESNNFAVGGNLRFKLLPVKTSSRRNKFGFEIADQITVLKKENDLMSVKIPFNQLELNLVYEFALVKEHLFIDAKAGAGISSLQKNVTYTNNINNRSTSVVNYHYIQAQGGISITLMPITHFAIEMGGEFAHIFINDMPTGIVTPYVCIGCWF